ncbi:MAG TPA: L-seryl-tRNA(Sec) selenium transferase, partial [bacterium]|nr:L-seryl-tRNA(Sec) selenium transferase [bacterium]
MSADRAARLRRLPAVDQVLREVVGRPETREVPRPRLTALVRDVLEAERRRVLNEEAEPPDSTALVGRVLEQVGRQGAFSLRPVINATGVVLHTNLGRALLSPLARERLQAVAGAYSNLEMDVGRKERGSRYAHVDGLLQRLTGAEASLVVNNCASAV